MGVLANDMNAYVMGFFLSLSFINVWENTDTFKTRRTKLDGLQWASSICQLLNLIVHMVLNTSKYIHCNHAVNAETIFFYCMQLGTGYVIIYRATAVIPKPSLQILTRYGTAAVLATSVGFNLASDILRKMEVIEGTCVPIFHRQLNDVSKIILGVVYMGLFIAFVVPIVKNVRNAGQYINTSSLRDLATITGIKISFAIFVMLITVFCSIFGVFGAYFWIQFTVQNFAMVWASTVASRKPTSRAGSAIVLTPVSKQSSKTITACTKITQDYSVIP